MPVTRMNVETANKPRTKAVNVLRRWRIRFSPAICLWCTGNVLCLYTADDRMRPCACRCVIWQDSISLLSCFVLALRYLLSDIVKVMVSNNIRVNLQKHI